MENKIIQITIDGKKIEAIEGQLITDVAQENGIYIPTLCYFKEIYPPLATCRVCSVRVNGRMETACTTKVSGGMEIEVNAPDVLDNRKAIVEMMFAEGNHYCPSCAKSGNCDLQNKGYRLDVAISRFPHLFEPRPKDFKPSRIYMEHDRCILCKRCVERIKTDTGENVFFLQNRGHKTLVGVDYEKEKLLTEEQALEAMDLCPVGAIMVKGEYSHKPFGMRKYDFGKNLVPIEDPVEPELSLKPGERKKVIATTSLAGCFGCHMSILDVDLGLIDALELVEFNKSPLTDIKNFTKRCDVGIIEGGVATSDNYEVLMEFRKKCDVLIALGECAVWGGLPAMRNTLSIEECLQEAYVDGVTVGNKKHIIPYHEDIPKMLDKVYAPNDIVKIDYFLPGCPPNSDFIWKMIKNVLFDANIPIEYNEFKYD
jgi:[NiFe] hydrogenase diaphorase moiety small subunit